MNRNRWNRWVSAFRFPVAIFLILGALTHLWIPWPYQMQLPLWVPHSEWVVRGLSVVQLLAGVSIWIPRVSRVAIQLLAVLIALKAFLTASGISLAETAEEVGSPFFRLAIQAMLLLWCLWFIVWGPRNQVSAGRR
jgi:uncharacterized membrane protein